MRCVSCVAALLVCVLMPATTATSSGSPRAHNATVHYTIRTNQGAVVRIGSFHPRRDAKLAVAIRVFGQPSSRHLTKYNACNVKWRRIGLRITFVSYAVGPRANICSPAVGLAQSFAASGSRFRTWAGLRPGMRSSRIADLHPYAELRRGRWWLRTAVSPFGDQSEYPVVSALISGGRVSALSGWIGAAGE